MLQSKTVSYRPPNGEIIFIDIISLKIEILLIAIVLIINVEIFLQIIGSTYLICQLYRSMFIKYICFSYKCV